MYNIDFLALAIIMYQSARATGGMHGRNQRARAIGAMHAWSSRVDYFKIGIPIVQIST